MYYFASSTSQRSVQPGLSQIKIIIIRYNFSRLRYITAVITRTVIINESCKKLDFQRHFDLRFNKFRQRNSLQIPNLNCYPVACGGMNITNITYGFAYSLGMEIFITYAEYMETKG